MRVVATTRIALRHRYFLALLRQRLGSDLVGVLIQESPPKPSSLHQPEFRSQRVSVSKLRYSVQLRFRSALARLSPDFVQYLEPARTRSVDSYLRSEFAGVEATEPWDGVEVCYAPDPNTDEAFAWLRRLEPDLVVVFGGRILKGPWIDLPPLGTINMHYGILPYYRGAKSTIFALYHDRLDRLGGTVHIIDPGVDAGPTIRKCHVPTGEKATVAECVAHVYAAGIRGLVECAEDVVRSGQRPAAVPEEKTAFSYFPGSLGIPRLNPLIESVAQARLTTSVEDWPMVVRLDQRLRRSRPRPVVAAGGALRRFTVPPGVYILGYHSIVDPACHEPWETQYGKMMTSARHFDQHLAYLSSVMTPIKLSEIYQKLYRGPADRPYFVVTFDDAYGNLLRTAAPICRRYGISPAVFVNGRFCAGEDIYYRVLLSVLRSQGNSAAVANSLNHEFGATRFTPENVFDLAKDTYEYPETPRGVLAAWDAVWPGQPWPQAHLTFDELRLLEMEGWEIGNHTLDHPTISGLVASEIDRQILGNQQAMEKGGLHPLKWIAYPNGTAKDVGVAGREWMDQHPDFMGLHLNGGVNFFPSRTEWLRIGIGDLTLAAFRASIDSSIQATASIIRGLTKQAGPAVMRVSR